MAWEMSIFVSYVQFGIKKAITRCEDFKLDILAKKAAKWRFSVYTCQLPQKHSFSYFKLWILETVLFRQNGPKKMSFTLFLQIPSETKFQLLKASNIWNYILKQKMTPNDDYHKHKDLYPKIWVKVHEKCWFWLQISQLPQRRSFSYWEL